MGKRIKREKRSKLAGARAILGQMNVAQHRELHWDEPIGSAGSALFGTGGIASFWKAGTIDSTQIIANIFVDDADDPGYIKATYSTGTEAGDLVLVPPAKAGATIPSVDIISDSTTASAVIILSGGSSGTAGVRITNGPLEIWDNYLFLKSTTDGGIYLREQSPVPAAPAANQVVIYSDDNGAGKTRLMARFPTGAAQQIAIEP